ncbi:putative amidohydrolase [Nocardia nova SH22a]|uniref:6-methylsalicylate decarboxylase n=1 Tax=Nocardia nova SH22a TaxID=1415166 RepID=W5TMU7_9NOCA|nr:amidohydrolase family protein [Nocardia nova]AHH18561.1 putative amidohydrolase [Nocardia nova SH22a]
MTRSLDPLIDVHAHFVTDRYIAAARAAGHDHPDGMPGWPEWSPRAHLALMDESGIATSMLSVSSPGVHFGDDAAARELAREVNEFGAAVVRDHPGRFGHLAALPLPDIDGSLTEIAHALDVLGCDGVAVETNAHGRYLGDAHFDPVWAELERREAVVFVHPTSPPHAESISVGLPRPMLEFLFDTARSVTDLLYAGVFERYSGIRWIFTHGGGVLPLVAERIQLFRSAFAGERQGRPTSEQLRGLWFDMAGTPFPHQIPALDAAFGIERLLYGSDYCWTPPGAVAAQIASIDAAPAPGARTWRQLTTDHARELFPALNRDDIV